MTRWSTILFLILICLLPAIGQGAPVSRLLVLGDSLSAAYGIPIEKGWVSLLQKRLDDNPDKWEVINASISGDTSAGGLTRIPAALQRYQPAIVLIELGGNDGLRGLSLKVLQQNLVEIARLARGEGASVLLLGIRLPANYGPRYGDRFQRVYREVAREADVPLVDFFLSGVAEHPGLMQADGIHPSATAQPRILENVWVALQPMIERRHAVRSSKVNR